MILNHVKKEEVVITWVDFGTTYLSFNYAMREYK